MVIYLLLMGNHLDHIYLKYLIHLLELQMFDLVLEI